MKFIVLHRSLIPFLFAASLLLVFLGCSSSSTSDSAPAQPRQSEYSSPKTSRESSSPKTPQLISNSANELNFTIKDFPDGWETDSAGREAIDGVHSFSARKIGTFIALIEGEVESMVSVAPDFEAAKSEIQEERRRITEAVTLAQASKNSELPRIVPLKIGDESFIYEREVPANKYFEVYFRIDNVWARIRQSEYNGGSRKDSEKWAKSLAERIQKLRRNIAPTDQSTKISLETPGENSSSTIIPESTIAQSNSLNPTPTLAPTLTPLPTNVFMAANSMSHARTAHAAVTLQDGRVLVAGGVNGFGSSEESLNSVEIFDPQTEEWAAGASLNISRDDFTMTLLKDGRVLASGGQGTNSLESGTSAEVYNPITNVWEFVGDMTMVRSHHNAILLDSGQVLIIGGNAHEITGYPDEAVSRNKSAEIFDPITNSFSAVADLNHERNYSLATLLQDGTVLVVGGIDNEAYASAEIFDPSSGSSSLTGLMTSGRRESDMVLLNDGTVFIRGGWGEKSSRSWASSELFDPQNGTLKEIAYSTGRSSHVSILLGNGSVLTTGGKFGSKTLDSSEIYIPSADSTGPSSVMTEPRQEHVMALTDDGRVLIIGGIGGSGVLSSVEIYYP